jgi:hypothetical protein
MGAYLDRGLRDADEIRWHRQAETQLDQRDGPSCVASPADKVRFHLLCDAASAHQAEVLAALSDTEVAPG